MKARVYCNIASEASGAITNKFSPPNTPYQHKSKSHTCTMHLLIPAASNKYNLFSWHPS